MQKNRAKR